MNYEFGLHGQQLVVSHLQKNDFTILEQNYKKFYGEIDIIARKNDTLAFIEVKTRKNSHVSLHELIPASKQRKIAKVAQSFALSKHLYENVLRFDVALVHIVGDNPPTLTYIADAFQTGY